MGAWQNDGSLIRYTTAPNTRSLSVTSNLQAISNATKVNGRIINSENVTTTMAILFYESPNASVAVLSRIATGCIEDSCPYSISNNPIYTGDPRNLSWINNNPALRFFSFYSVHPFDPQCHTPFASSQFTGDTNFEVITFCYSVNDIYTIHSTINDPESPQLEYPCKYQ